MNKTLAERFTSKIKIDSDSGCWLWMGSRRGSYGIIWNNNTNISVHRASWNIHRGDIPRGMWVLHRCDTPLCVNPDHLFLGTHRDNMIDAAYKGRLPVNQNGALHPAD